MSKTKSKNNVELITEEIKLYSSILEEKTDDYYDKKIKEVEKQVAKLWEILPHEKYKDLIDSLTMYGLLEPVVRQKKVPFHKRLWQRFLQQPCGAALIFAAVFLTYRFF